MPHNLRHIKACPVCANECLTRMQDYARCAQCGWDTKCGPNHVEQLKKDLNEKAVAEAIEKREAQPKVVEAVYLPTNEDLDRGWFFAPAQWPNAGERVDVDPELVAKWKASLLSAEGLDKTAAEADAAEKTAITQVGDPAKTTESVDPTNAPTDEVPVAESETVESVASMPASEEKPGQNAAGSGRRGRRN